MKKSVPLGWTSIKVQYKIMTDSDGVKWKVPTHIDGEQCIYLRKHDPNEYLGTFERHTIQETPPRHFHFDTTTK